MMAFAVMVAKVMVCVILLTAKLRVTCGAALVWASPAWLATRVQVPILSRVMSEPVGAGAVVGVAVQMVGVVLVMAIVLLSALTLLKAVAVKATGAVAGVPAIP